MIKRLYVDNFRCMVNFEYRPGAIELLFGDNGSGKSTTFDVLARLRDFIVGGQPTDQAFPASTLTVWDTRSEQTFEIEVQGDDGLYRYHAVIEHDLAMGRNHLKAESLRFNDRPLYHFDGQDAHLYWDDLTEGPVFPQDSTRSGIAAIPERRDNRKLIWFRHRIGSIYTLAIDPLRMENASFGERAAPDPGLTNFASWYRHLTQDSPEAMGPLFESLSDVMDGFAGLRLTSAGEMARVLRVVFKPIEKSPSISNEFTLTLSEISTGHRCLVALFTLLHCAVRPNVTLCIDEPDNFVALRELQPWLTALCDRVEQTGGQCLIISHHPEFIDLLAVGHGARFTRTGLGPVRIKPFDWSQAEDLRPSELMARGWED